MLGHLSHCLDVVRGRVGLDEWLGTELVSHAAGRGTIRLTCRSADGRLRTAETRRLIKAPGLAIEPNPPLAVSSERDHSVSPDFCDVRTGEIAESKAPVGVIGGGKTAMDTAQALIETCPGREVNVLAGPGTFFTSATRSFAAERGAGGAVQGASRRCSSGRDASTVPTRARRSIGTEAPSVALGTGPCPDGCSRVEDSRAVVLASTGLEVAETQRVRRCPPTHLAVGPRV